MKSISVEDETKFFGLDIEILQIFWRHYYTIIHVIQASYALNTQLRAPKVDKTYQKITAVDSFVRKNDFIYLLQNILEPGIFKVLYGVL